MNIVQSLVMLDELPKLLIGVIAAAAWKVHIVEYGVLACMAAAMLKRHWSPRAGRTSHGHDLDVS